jgi:hypothetical protein
MLRGFSYEKISKRDLDKACLKVKKFTRLTGTLYGQEQMIYNIHILQHVVESVRNWELLGLILPLFMRMRLGSCKDNTVQKAILCKCFLM